MPLADAAEEDDFEDITHVLLVLCGRKYILQLELRSAVFSLLNVRKLKVFRHAVAFKERPHLHTLGKTQRN